MLMWYKPKMGGNLIYTREFNVIQQFKGELRTRQMRYLMSIVSSLL